MNKKIKCSILLVLAAVIWGSSFVAQSTGGDLIGPFAFNSIRCFIGAIALVPVIFLFDSLGNPKKPATKAEKLYTLKAGAVCGFVLFFASNLQQYGITAGTDSGKAGFITAFYILMVPILGMFIGKKSGPSVWISVAIAIVALYLLCITSDFTVATSDIFELLCSIMFAVHILSVDHFVPKVDGVRLSCIQFVVAGLLGVVPSLAFDIVGGNGAEAFLSAFFTWDTMFPLLYSGVMSCGVAYTLQILGQDGGLNPSVASLLMSLESVCAVISGWLILNEHLSLREGIGCILMFTAVILAQMDFRSLVKNGDK